MTTPTPDADLMNLCDQIINEPKLYGEAVRVARALRTRISATTGERDDCEYCLGAKGGKPGNENAVNGRLVCDYCHALMMAEPTTAAQVTGDEIADSVLDEIEKRHATADDPPQYDADHDFMPDFIHAHHDRATLLKALRTRAPEPAVEVCRMAESNGRVTYYVQISRPGLSGLEHGFSLYSSLSKGRADYYADELRHQLGYGARPRILDYDDSIPDDQKKFSEPTAVQGVVDREGLAKWFYNNFMKMLGLPEWEKLIPGEHKTYAAAFETADALIASKLIAPMPTRDAIEEAYTDLGTDPAACDVGEAMLRVIKGER